MYLNHYNDYETNKHDFNQMINNIPKNQCVASIDFEEKIKIGHKQKEQSWVFRKLKLRNCLGIILKFTDEDLMFDAFTNVTNQTGLLSKCMIKHVLHHPSVLTKFQSLQINKLSTWFACGAHFSNRSIPHYFFHELAKDPLHEQLNEMRLHYHSGKLHSILAFLYARIFVRVAI